MTLNGSLQIIVLFRCDFPGDKPHGRFHGEGVLS
jgi:hypothetical protein